MSRSTSVLIPGRVLSTAGRVEMAGGRLFALAERHYEAAGVARSVVPWACAKAFADGLVHAFAVVADLERHEADSLFAQWAGDRPGWLIAGPPPGAPARAPCSRTNADQLGLTFDGVMTS